jgi:uncharacterized protein (TIGR03086 family)
MDQQQTLAASIDRLRSVIDELNEDDFDTTSNCGAWSVRQLASHALNNQLLWGGVVTGTPTVSAEDTTGGTPIEGDLSRAGAEVAERALALWSTPGVLASTHTTPFGELPGSVVINFPIFDALVHAWDLSTSTGRRCEFSESELAAISLVADSAFAEGARAAQLIGPPADVPAAATNTERAMAKIGRNAAPTNRH